MSRSGIRRKVDDLGRVVIPVGMRRTLGISEGDELEFAVEDDRIVLDRPQDRCVVCSQDNGLIELRGRHVCGSCVEELNSLVSDQVVVIPEIESASNTAW